MKVLKSLLMGTGSLALAALVFALVAPKAAHAVAAAAVLVTNTITNPAMTQDVSKMATQIVTISCTASPGSTLFGLTCSYISPSLVGAPSPGPSGGYIVPANQYLVVTSIDTETGINGNVSISLVNDRVGGVEGNAGFYEVIVAPGSGQVQLSSGIVVAPGAELFAFPIVNMFVGTVTLHGYLTSN